MLLFATTRTTKLQFAPACVFATHFKSLVQCVRERPATRIYSVKGGDGVRLRSSRRPGHRPPAVYARSNCAKSCCCCPRVRLRGRRGSWAPGRVGGRLASGYAGWLVGWLVDRLAAWSVSWPVAWPGGWRAGWLTAWLADWLAGYLDGWPAGWLASWGSRGTCRPSALCARALRSVMRMHRVLIGLATFSA